jgi:hypothetical protein
MRDDLSSSAGGPGGASLSVSTSSSSCHDNTPGHNLWLIPNITSRTTSSSRLLLLLLLLSIASCTNARVLVGTWWRFTHAHIKHRRACSAMKKWRILTVGISGDELTRPFSRRPPIPFNPTVARTHMYTYAAKVWDMSIVQGPVSVAPCQTRYDSQLFQIQREV